MTARPGGISRYGRNIHNLLLRYGCARGGPAAAGELPCPIRFRPMVSSSERSSQADRANGPGGHEEPRSRFRWSSPSFAHIHHGKKLRRERAQLAARREQPQQHFLLARLRMLTRRGEVWLVLLAIVIGALAGLAVVALRLGAEWMHVFLYQLRPQDRLSGMSSISVFPGALVPFAGGVLLGALTLLLRRGRNRPMVDPVEANALHGGRMSLTDSLIIVVQTLVSNGFGASVGLEAAYTQIGSGMASKIAARFRLRRRDMRMLVGCGAAGAIAARLRRAADRRLLRLRTDHRHLHDHGAGAGDLRIHRRGPDFPGGRRRAYEHLRACQPGDERHADRRPAAAWPVQRSARHHHHVSRHHRRGSCSPRRAFPSSRVRRSAESSSAGWRSSARRSSPPDMRRCRNPSPSR